MDETKKILRSILVSSPHIISVVRLNHDYKELVGEDIPYQKLGFTSLSNYLNSIPDVLRTNGSSMQSQVFLVESEKTAHVNEMVLRQKVNKKQIGSFYSPRIRHGPVRTNQRVHHARVPQQPERFRPQIVPHPRFDSGSYLQYDNFTQKKQTNNGLTTTAEPSCMKNPKDSDVSAPSSHEFDSKTSNLLNVNMKLKDSNKIALDSEKKTLDTNYLRKIDYKSYANVTQIPSLLDMKSTSLNEVFLAKKNDFMRQLMLDKDKIRSQPNKSIPNINQPNVDAQVNSSADSKNQKYSSNCKVPIKIQDNLKQLMTKFPEGIWCTELQGLYKKFIGKKLDYMEFGYSCLINMCLDLENIFYCRKESACDFKLYDAMKPLPKIEILQHPADLDSSKIEPKVAVPDALPTLDWESYSSLIPDDIVPLKAEIPRDFVSDGTKIEDVLDVLVAEVYDPSKFWISIDDGELDRLMDNMQSFYTENCAKYMIPEFLLEPGLYCVVITLKEFHRASIISIEQDDDFIKVFFIDYGSLRRIPKKEVWFLASRFGHLPGKAIRARLADIYPPLENSIWSREATYKFRELACMKHVKAKIARIVCTERIVEVYIENVLMLPGQYINSVLINEGLALPTSKPRLLCIEDPHCTPKVKFVHLYPTFTEIEYWVVPSVEDMLELSDSNVTPDFFFPQYFTRSVNTDLLDQVDKKYKKILKTRPKLIKYVDVKKLEPTKDINETNKLIYGDLFEEWDVEVKQRENLCYSLENSEESKDCDNKYLDNYTSFLNKLRNKPSEDEEKNMDPSVRKILNSQKKINAVCQDFYGKTFDDYQEIELENRRISKSTSQIDFNLRSVSELEKYLSEDDSTSREPSPTTSKLIDLDDTFDTYLDFGNSSKYERPSLFLNKYNSSVQNSRLLPSLLTDSNPSDDEIFSTPAVKSFGDSSSSTTCSDFINLDVELHSPILFPEVVGSANKNESSRTIGLANVHQEEELNPDSRLKPYAPLFLPRSKEVATLPKKACCDESIQTDEVFCDSKDNSIGKMSDLSSPIVTSSELLIQDSSISSAVSVTSISETKGCDTVMSSSDTSTGVTMYPKRVVGPPPGFGPIPMYCQSIQRNPVVDPNYAVYPAWSTSDCSSGAYIARPPPRQFTMSNGTMNYHQLYSQVSSLYQCQPIIVVNYGGVPFIPPNVHYPQIDRNVPNKPTAS